MRELCQGLVVNALRPNLRGVVDALRANLRGRGNPVRKARCASIETETHDHLGNDLGAHSSWAMLAGEIMLCLHFDEAARGALKLEPEPSAAIQRSRRRGRRYHDLDAAIVEFVDGGDEAARGVLVGLGELG